VGLGFIGKEGFRALFRNAAVSDLPFIMETPESRDDSAEIKRVRDLSA